MKYFLLFFTTMLIISCTEDDPIDSTLNPNFNLCEEDYTLIPHTDSDVFFTKVDLPGIDTLDMCNLNRPAISATKNGFASVKKDIYDNTYISLGVSSLNTGGAFDTQYNAMVCCGLPDELNNENQIIKFTGVFRNMEGIPITANLNIIQGDTIASSTDEVVYCIVHLLEVAPD